jgi:hypothetical protein
MLFRLKDATLHDGNCAEFQRLFVQGVGNYLLGFASHTAHIDRARMLELESFMNDNSVRVGRFMGQMARSAPNAFGVVFGKKGDARPSREDLVAESAEFTALEQGWLDQMIAADGATDSYEDALIAFIAEEAGEA